MRALTARECFWADVVTVLALALALAASGWHATAPARPPAAAAPR